MTRKILVLGEPLQETDQSGTIGVSGDAVNFASGTLLMQPGIKELLGSDETVQVGLIGTLGDSEPAKRVEAYLEEKGIRRDLIKTVPNGILGEYTIKHDPTGGKGFHFKNREIAAFRQWFKPEYAPARAEALRQIDADTTLVLSGITVSRAETQEDFEQLYTFVREARSQGARIVFDTNNREKLWQDRVPQDVPEGFSATTPTIGPKLAANRIGAIMGLATALYITAPDDTKLWLSGTRGGKPAMVEPDYFAKTLLDTNVRLQQVIMKKGEDGATLYMRPATKNLAKHHLSRDTLLTQEMPIKPAKAFVDSGGAGDNFMAGTETTLALTPGIDMHDITLAQMKKAMSVGTCGASNVVQQHGCVLRTSPTVKEMMEHHAALPVSEITQLVTEQRSR